jgi:hypothetical protein
VQFQDDVAAGVVLVRPAVQSPGYVPGSSGWKVGIDGSAEFNDVTVRGTLESSNYAAGVSGWHLDQNGSAEFNNVTIRGGTSIGGASLYYTGTPGAGTLAMSLASAAGTDPYGTAYPSGLSIGTSTGRQITLTYNANIAAISFSTNRAVAELSGQVLEGPVNQGAANEYASLQLLGPTVKTFNDRMAILMGSQNADGSSNANIQISNRSGLVVMTLDPTAITTGVPITSYAGNNFTTYTPTVTGDGGATWTTRTGRWQQIGKWAWVEIDLQVATAGAGTTPISVTAPVTLDKSVRQFLPGNGDSLTGNSGS